MRRTYIFLIVALLLITSVSAFSGSGSGNSTDPFQITTCTQLQEMQNNLTAYYKIMNNIDCSATTTWNGGAGFAPITPFSGNLNGQKYNITNLYISRVGSGEIALIGRANSATITNVKIENASIFGSGYSAILVGYSASTYIINCSTDGRVIANQGRSAGLVGQADVPLINTSYSTANVTAPSYSGGLVGYCSGASGSAHITNSFHRGVVTCGTGGHCGGLLGEDACAGINSNSYSSSVVTCGGTNTTCGLLMGVVGCGSGDNYAYVNLYHNNESSLNTTQRITWANGLLFGCQRATPLTDAQTQNQSSFVNWDFSNIWEMCPAYYPHLLNLGGCPAPVCEPVWACTAYGECINGEQSCVAVTDINDCGQNYTGDYSEIPRTECGVIFEGDYCYQPIANVSTDCGGLDTGSYSCSDGWVVGSECERAFDNNLNTYNLCDRNNDNGGTCSFYMNWTTPVYSTGLVLEVITTGNSANVTLPESCWNYGGGIKRLYGVEHAGLPYTGYLNIYCLNSTGWQQIFFSDGSYASYPERIAQTAVRWRMCNWQCSAYGDCHDGRRLCLDVEELNGCGMEFDGNYSQYDQLCGAIPCYQEFANATDFCGAIGTGGYVDVSNSLFWHNNWYLTIDGDWSTYTWNGYTNVPFPNGSSRVYYPIPIGAIGADWQVKSGSGIQNLTIPQDCWDYSLNTLTMQFTSTDGAGYWYCYNGTNKVLLTSSRDIYEEGVWWHFECPPDWVCSAYTGCAGTGSTNNCTEVSDLNECGVEYAGNLYDFNLQCGYQPRYNASEDFPKITIDIIGGSWVGIIAIMGLIIAVIVISLLIKAVTRR